jgi:SAM-dependent methyltransferase
MVVDEDMITNNGEDYENVPCAVCKSKSFSQISAEVRFGGESRVVICETCGLVQLNPRWNAEKYLDYYKNQYYNDYSETSSDRFRKIKIITYRLLDSGYLPKNPKNILEIGAAKGDSLEYLREKLFPKAAYFAIEPSLSCQEELKKKSIELVANSVEESDTEKYKGNFDLIIIRHVAEHFMQPVISMKKIAALLSPSGLLYIAVPNAMNPTHPIKNNHFRNVHTYYYNRYSFDNLLKISGLEAKQVIEGDKFLISELVFFTRRSGGKKEPVFNLDMIEKQKKIYKERLSKEEKFSTKLIYFVNRVFTHYYSKILLKLIEFKKIKEKIKEYEKD